MPSLIWLQGTQNYWDPMAGPRNTKHINMIKFAFPKWHLNFEPYQFLVNDVVSCPAKAASFQHPSHQDARARWGRWNAQQARMKGSVDDALILYNCVLYTALSILTWWCDVLFRPYNSDGNMLTNWQYQCIHSFELGPGPSNMLANPKLQIYSRGRFAALLCSDFSSLGT